MNSFQKKYKVLKDIKERKKLTKKKDPINFTLTSKVVGANTVSSTDRRMIIRKLEDEKVIKIVAPTEEADYVTSVDLLDRVDSISIETLPKFIFICGYYSLISTVQQVSGFLKNKKYLNTGFIILLLITLLSAGYKISGIQIGPINLEPSEETPPPLFKYSFDSNEKVFKVTGDENVDVISADWFMIGYWGWEENKLDLKKVNNLDKELSVMEIRDAYGTPLVNMLQKWGKDLIECEFFRLTQDALPVMVTTIYDTTEKTGLENKDLLIITRIDTTRPNPKIFIRNVTDYSIVNDFFNKYSYQIIDASEHIKNDYEYSNENYTGGIRLDNGKCMMIENQPLGGY